ncbi:MAG: hypothetical protein WKF75_10665 [Singulisphaera sp.]
MAHLIDTSILARLANTVDASHALPLGLSSSCTDAARSCVAPQNLVEFRNVATRPAAMNGLGLSTVDAEAKLAVFRAAFPLLMETPDIYPAWKALVGALAVVGKQVHDARLVAVCHVHRVTHLLTFNVSHFSRRASFGPGVVVVDPVSV